MSLFEHCELLLRDNALDRRNFSSMFGYRVANIMAHKRIVATKFENDFEDWGIFLDLARRLGRDTARYRRRRS